MTSWLQWLLTTTFFLYVKTGQSLLYSGFMNLIYVCLLGLLGLRISLIIIIIITTTTTTIILAWMFGQSCPWEVVFYLLLVLCVLLLLDFKHLIIDSPRIKYRLMLYTNIIILWKLNIWNVYLFWRLPLPMQLTLLQDLLYLTLEKDIDVETHWEMDLDSCPGHVLFAITLYHRWVLRAVMYSRLAMKQTRQPYIPVWVTFI